MPVVNYKALACSLHSSVVDASDEVLTAKAAEFPTTHPCVDAKLDTMSSSRAPELRLCAHDQVDCTSETHQLGLCFCARCCSVAYRSKCVQVLIGINPAVGYCTLHAASHAVRVFGSFIANQLPLVIALLYSYIIVLCRSHMR
jgi:hypothetical protein